MSSLSPFSCLRRRRLMPASRASEIEERLRRQGNLRRRRRCLLSKRRNHRREIDRRIRIPVERCGRVQKEFGAARKGQQGRQQEQQDPKRRMRGRQQWGSCCRRQYGAGTWRATHELHYVETRTTSSPWARSHLSAPSLCASLGAP